MYDLPTHFLDAWFENGGAEINFYEYQIVDSQYGNWGLRQYYDTPLADLPKLKAVEDYMAKIQPTATFLYQPAM